MSDFEALGVRRIVAPNASPMTGDGTNTYLLGEREVAVIDPGPDIPKHVDAIVAAARERRRRLTQVLVTHAHIDHLPAAFALRRLTGATILGHPSILGIDQPLRDGDAVHVERLRLDVYETPGHAPDHLCFWHGEARLLFSGDLVAGEGTVVLDEAPDALVHYLNSLDRMAAFGPMAIMPGHGPAISDGGVKLFEYLEHRAHRDRQILAALHDGPQTVDGIVARIYVGIDLRLVPLSARNVRAHLYRLQSNGSAQEAAGFWRLT